jgi:mono/diheme cytochrome c family protein
MIRSASIRAASIRVASIRAASIRAASIRAAVTRTALLVLLLACSCKTGGGGAAGVDSAVQDVVEGRKIYLTYGCVGCHGVNGGGGMGKPILDDEWIFGSDDATLFKLIRGEVPKQTMPNTIGKALTDEQVRQVITYVRFIYQGDKAKITWTVPPAVSDELLRASVSTGDPVAAGKILFQSACVQCHGPEGRGDGLAAAPLNPKPRDLTDSARMATVSDRFKYELISRGGIAVGKSPQMPAFPLNRDDINNIIAYVDTLSKSAVVQTATGNKAEGATVPASDKL